MFALLLFYHLVLEKEKMHQFNRFYLLFSLLFSFAIPFITIEIIEETIVPIQQTYSYVALENLKVVEVKETIDYKPIILWSIYGLITSILLFRYLRNILRIISNIKSSTIIEYKNSKLVLLEEETPPHTFLNCIFLNKTDYENRKIEEELYTHELIHVTQKHTLDVLFIEALKTVFWFNPLFIFYKKAIQLNHEFLADEKVVNSYDNVPFYQNLLLAHANKKPTFALTSNLNYSVTKKRFIMMTKTVSKTKTFLYKITLLPLFSGLIYFMCVESVAQEKPITPSKSTTQPEKKITQPVSSKDKLRDEYYAGVQIIINDCNKKTLINKKYEELTLEEKNRFLFYVPSPKISKNPTEKEFNSWKNEKDFAIWLDGKNIPNSELDKYTTKDIAYFAGSFVYKNARTKKHPQLHQYSLYTKEYFDKNLKDSHLKFYGKELRMTLMGKKQDKAQPDKTKTINIQENEIYSLSAVNEKPNFFGGIEKFYEFVGKNYKAPSQPNLKGKVYITFVVEKDGGLSDIRVVKDAGYGTGEEAVRVLKLSPKWIPGKINGNPVRVLYSLPITIQSAN
ncbi:biotin transporter BioY [Flavobacterium gilvum]|nr:biotin transporter BioY [Flavobacterium gilvum]